MAFVMINVAQSSYIADPSTGAVRGFFTKIDKISVDFDGSMTAMYGGAGTLPILNIPKDRKPVVELDGPEIPLQVISKILGASAVKASTGTPVQVPWSEPVQIQSDGSIPLTYPISATNQNVSVITDLDFQVFSAAASTPTQGQFVTPIAGATKLTGNSADAGKVVLVAYTFDSTTGGKIGYGASSVPEIHKFVAAGTMVNTSDPSRTPFPAAIVVPQCQLDSKWTADAERNKVSASKMPLTILDPGPGLDAAQIIPTKNFM